MRIFFCGVHLTEFGIVTTLWGNLFSGDDFGLVGEYGSVWYRALGTGGTLEASTCNPGTDSTFDTKLHVFVADCRIGSCIAGNDNFNSQVGCSLVTWPTAELEEYFIMVHGALTDQGLFELSLRSI